MGTITILPETTKNPITLMGQRAGVCWGADTSDDAKNYQRGLDCIQSGHGRVMEYVNVEMVIDWSDEAQMTFLFAAFSGSTVAVSRKPSPSVTVFSVSDRETTVTGMMTSFSSTVTIQKSTLPPSSVFTVMTAVPGAFAVTAAVVQSVQPPLPDVPLPDVPSFPPSAGSTEAISGSELTQRTF